MKTIFAFLKHSLISFKIRKQHEARRHFFYTGRLYAGYVGLYAAIPISFKDDKTIPRLYITIWLFKPTSECKQLMIKSGKY
jgi:hypothetical protein